MKKLILLLCIINIHSNALKKKLVILGSAFGTFVLCTGFFQWHKSRSLSLQDLKTEKEKLTWKAQSDEQLKAAWSVFTPTTESKALIKENLIHNYSFDNIYAGTGYLSDEHKKRIIIWKNYLEENNFDQNTLPHQGVCYNYLIWLQKKISAKEKTPLYFFIPSPMSILTLISCANFFIAQYIIKEQKYEYKILLDIYKRLNKTLEKTINNQQNTIEIVEKIISDIKK